MWAALRARSLEVDLTSSVNRPLKHRALEHDWFNLNQSCSNQKRRGGTGYRGDFQTALRKWEVQRTVTADQRFEMRYGRVHLRAGDEDTGLDFKDAEPA